MLEIIDHDVAREIRLVRPPVNAFNTELLVRLNTALDAARPDGCRALVLSGRPGVFSAGLDVPELLTLDPVGMLRFWEAFFGAQSRLAGAPVPVAAAITGHSPAGGAVLAMYCDYRVMAAGTYRIGLNEVQVGLFPGPIIYGALRRLVGPRVADRLIVGGILLTPEEALSAGLVDRVTDEGDVIPAALDWARQLASLPPQAVARTRALARADLVTLTANLGLSDYEAMNEAWFGAETQTTMRALVERLRRKP
jgi:enoyl-CoA hydratase/carnithine racemase